jgi:formylmethanofuran dehydrogenase subunit E
MINSAKNREKIIEPKLKELMTKAVKFHGHACPGLAIGVIGSKIALEHAKRAVDEELVAVVENDACGVDAIQVLTGCTFGKGNFIHKDFGKSVYTFYNRESKKALRLSLKSDVFNLSSPERQRRKELFTKIQTSTASNAEIVEHKQLLEQYINSILSMGEKIFKIENIEMTPPDKARTFENITCERCGEPFMSTRLCEKDGKKLCIPCCKEIDNDQ